MYVKMMKLEIKNVSINITLIKSKINLFRQKIFQSATIESCQNINLRPEICQIPLSQANTHDYKKLRENS